MFLLKKRLGLYDSVKTNKQTNKITTTKNNIGIIKVDFKAEQSYWVISDRTGVPDKEDTEHI